MNIEKRECKEIVRARHHIRDARKMPKSNFGRAAPAECHGVKTARRAMLSKRLFHFDEGEGDDKTERGKERLNRGAEVHKIRYCQVAYIFPYNLPISQNLPSNIFLSHSFYSPVMSTETT